MFAQSHTWSVLGDSDIPSTWRITAEGDHLFSTPSPLSPKSGLKLKVSKCERGYRSGLSEDRMLLKGGTSRQRKCSLARSSTEMLKCDGNSSFEIY